MGINRIATDGSGTFGQAPDGGGHSPGHTQPEARGHADGSDVSALASALSALAQLQQGDPARFQLVVNRVANVLREQGGAATGARALSLKRLADRFDEAARAGSLSSPGLAESAGGPPGELLLNRTHSYGAGQSWSEASGSTTSPGFDLAGAIETALQQLGVH